MSAVFPPSRGVFDEMLLDVDTPRASYRSYHDWLANVAEQELRSKRHEAELLFQRVGITFAVYGEEEGAERLIPFDFVPRIISAEEWQFIETGLCQRVAALNAFLKDIYSEQAIIKAGIVPADNVMCNAQYQVGASQRWELLRAGRQSARTLRCFLHAGKSQKDDAIISSVIRRTSHCAG